MIYDLGFIGGGPIGLTLACLTQVLTNKRICILEKREQPTRNHGLKINNDSIDKIQNVLKTSLEHPEIKHENVKKLQNIFSKWSGHFVRTATIEDELAKVAKDLGIKIIRKQNVTEENFEMIFFQKKSSLESEEIYEIFKDIPIILGTDGSHSITRQMTGNKLTEQQTLRQLLEFKYQSHGSTEPRGYMEATTNVIKHGNLNFENMSYAQTEKRKPVTLHIFIDRETFAKLRFNDEKGNLKGIFGNHLTLSEIKELGESDQKIKKLYAELIDNIDQIKKRGGDCFEEQITTLEMNVYKSERIVTLHEGRYYILAGDAAAGIVLERGFNTGLKGCALIVQALQAFFSKPEIVTKEMPIEFKELETKYLTLFQDEVKKANRKNSALNMVETGVASSHHGIETSSQLMEYSASGFSLLGKITDLFSGSRSKNEVEGPF